MDNFFNALVKNDFVEILNEYSKFNEDSLKNAIIERKDDVNSLFISLLSKTQGVEQVEKLLLFFEKYGYDIRGGSVKEKNIFLNKNIQKEDTEGITMPDFLMAFKVTRDEKILIYLIEKVGLNYLKELKNDGWDLLPTLFWNKKSGVIKKLFEMGFGLENTEADLHYYCASNQEMLNLYWEGKKKLNKEISEKELSSIIEKYHEDAQYTKKGSVNQSERVKFFYNTNESLLSNEQKEKLLISSTELKTTHLFKFLSKKMKKEGFDLDNILLENFLKIKNREIIVDYLSSADVLFKKDSGGFYLFEKLFVVCKNMGVEFYNFYNHEYGRDKEKKANSLAIINKLKELISEEVFLDRRVNIGDENLSLFQYSFKIFKDKKYYNLGLKNLITGFMTDFVEKRTGVRKDVGVEKFDDLRKILDKSWFLKDGEEYWFKKYGIITDIFPYEIIGRNGFKNNFFNKDELSFIFTETLNAYSGYSSLVGSFKAAKNFKDDFKDPVGVALYCFEELKKMDVEWDNLKFSEGFWKGFENTDLGFEIKMLQDVTKLNRDLNNKLSAKEKENNIKAKI